jgi:hypothetical protein
VQWLTPIILAIWEAERGELKFGKVGKTPSEQRNLAYVPVVPAMWWAIGRSIISRLAPGKNMRPYPKKKTKKAKRAIGMGQVVASKRP